MLKKVLNHQTSTLGWAAALLGVFSIINGLLGLLRDRLLAGRFGAGEELDVYFAAFRIPDFIYGVLVAGGIISVFLPIFAEHFDKKEKDAWRYTNAVLNCFLVLLIFLCLILLIFTPWIAGFITPGFKSQSRDLVVSLTRIMLLSPVFFVLSSVFSGILHYFHRFLIYSLAPIFYTLGIIFGIVFLTPLYGVPGLAYGVILGAFLHLALQIPPAILAGYRYQPIFDFKNPGIVKTFKLLFPRTIGAIANHLNLIIITAIASTLASGSIAIFNFSDNLQKFPVGLIGVSLATASFPILTRAWARGQKKEFLEKFFATFRQTLFFIIPISLLMFLLRAQLVRLILGTGQFGWLETRLTAASLGIFALGIFAICLIPLLVRVFFSFQDTKTPVAISVASVASNVLFAFLFVWLLNHFQGFQQFLSALFKLQGIENIQVVGLSLALCLSGILNFFLLCLFLYLKITKIDASTASFFLVQTKELYNSIRKILIAAICLIIIAYPAIQFIAPLVNMQKFWGVFIQTALAGSLGAFVYLLTSYLLKSPEVYAIRNSLLDFYAKHS